ncbi:hypothetical protein [Clostridium hydrogeniformans]|uniref:hypothetical protein n=1 Tax=Clostridium hydrogeniformans TaxID=349933 RepID=UPI0006911A45|nr:hypothetical protein [Clostridium hydrogeniformans]
MSKVKDELALYKQLKADIVSLELDIQEIKNDSGLKAISYNERVQISPKNDAMDKIFEAKEKEINELLYKKERLELKIKRIDNALSVLSGREKQVITMLYIEKLPHGRVEVEIDRSYHGVRNISIEGLRKIQRLCKK